MPSNQYRPLTKKKGLLGGRAASSLRGRLQRTLRDPYLVAKTNRALTLLAAAFLALTGLFSLASPGATARAAELAGAGETNGVTRCNPFLLPGYIAQLPSGLSTFRTYDPACRPPGLLPLLLSHLPSSPYHARVLVPPDLKASGALGLGSKMANRTVFLIGDSTDQYLAMHFCHLVGRSIETVNQRHPWGASLAQVSRTREKLSHAQEAYANYNPGDKPLAHYCYVPEYDFLLSSVYHMGTDIGDTFAGQPAWTAPSQFEDRLEDLFVPYAKAMSQTPQSPVPSLPPPRKQASPDVAVLASSLWDLARFAQEDIGLLRSLVDDLNEGRLSRWRGRHVDMLAALHKAWPDAKLGWRSLHLPTDTETATVEWWVEGQTDKITVSERQTNFTRLLR